MEIDVGELEAKDQKLILDGLLAISFQPTEVGRNRKISGQDKPAHNTTSMVTSTSRFPHKLRSAPVPINKPTPPGVNNQSNGYGLHFNGNNYECSRRVIGVTLDTISGTRSRCYDISNQMSYSSY
ncbi:hypothetical protein TB2_033347 [Malus domestica]